MAEFKSFPVAEWFKADGSFRRLGRAKLAQLQTFNSSILPYISPYFADIIPCIQAFHHALCAGRGGDSRDSLITHDQVIDIFNKTLDSLPELEDFTLNAQHISSSSQYLEDVGSEGRKRSIFDVDSYGIQSKRSRRSDMYFSHSG